MSIGIKYGKDHTFNIYSIILILLFNFTLTSFSFAPSPKTNGKWVIVIDPGHGGRDSGAVGSISKEKDINLAIALKTARYIRENIKDATVVLTRNDDSTVELDERPKIANRNNADLFISIHTNSSDKSKNVFGAETWIMGLALNEENLAVAMKENEVILLEEDHSAKYEGFDPRTPESYIIFSLTQNVYQRQSTELAQRIQDQFRERVNRKDRSVKQAGFLVLYKTAMPSVLVETGFISTPAEEKYLNSDQGQDYLASAIYRACREYTDEIDLRSVTSIEQTRAKSNAAVAGTAPVTSTAPDREPSSDTSAKISAGSRQGMIIFHVQVAAASEKTQISSGNFKGLTDIREIKTGDRYRYVTGIFDDYPEAVRHRKKIESIYPDAFVIALKDNKILPLQQALEQKRKK